MCACMYHGMHVEVRGHLVGSRGGTLAFSPGRKHLYSPTRRRLKLRLMSKHMEAMKSLATGKGFWTCNVMNPRCIWERLPMLHPAASLQPWLCPVLPLPPHSAVLIDGARNALIRVVDFHVVMGCSTVTMHTPFSVPVEMQWFNYRKQGLLIFLYHHSTAANKLVHLRSALSGYLMLKFSLWDTRVISSLNASHLGIRIELPTFSKMATDILLYFVLCFYTMYCSQHWCL